MTDCRATNTPARQLDTPTLVEIHNAHDPIVNLHYRRAVARELVKRGVMTRSERDSGRHVIVVREETAV